MKTDRVRRFFPGLILLVGLGGLFGLGLGGPWKQTDHSGSGGAFFSVIARNYIRYGKSTGLGQVMNTGPVARSRFVYYTHHPPLTSFLVAAGFLLFGEHEWAARLPFLICSLFFLAALFGFTRDLYGYGTAYAACAAAVLMPAFTAYRDMVGVMAPLLCFSMFTLLFYRKWHRSGKSRHLVLALASYLLALFSHEMACFLLLPIAAHDGWSRRASARPFRKRLLLFPLAAAGSIALHLFHNLLLTGSPFGGGLIRAFLFRLGLVRGTPWDFTAAEWAGASAQRMFWLFTGSGLLLAGRWVAVRASKWKTPAVLEEGDVWIFSLFLFGLAPNVLFPNLSYIHIFCWMTLLPAFSLSVARSLVEWRWSRPLLVSLVLVAVLQSGVALWRLSIYDIDVRFFKATTRSHASEMGDEIRRLTRPGERIGASFRDVVVFYYADRTFVPRIHSVARFENTRRIFRLAFFLDRADDPGALDPALRAVLEKMPVVFTIGPYTLYDLRVL